VVPDVSANVDHRTRTTAQAGTRRPARLRLGSARPMPAVRHDVHCAAQLVRAAWALHATLPTTSLGGSLQRRQKMGTGRTPVPGSHSSARSEHAASLGLAQNDQPVVCGQRLLVGAERWEVFADTHHPHLGLAGRQPYSAAGDKLAMSWQVAPPLLVFGRPALAWLWALPLPARVVIGRIWVRTGLRHFLHQIGTPAAMWILCSAALWFWHLPAPFAWSLASEPVHALEHICFFGTSLLFWSLVLEPLAKRRIAYGITIIFLGTFGLQMGLMGALLTFAGHPLYAAYLQTTQHWGLSPLEDQQLGGLSMWIPASLIHLITLGVLVAAWMRQDEYLSIAAASSHRNSALAVSTRPF